MATAKSICNACYPISSMTYPTQWGILAFAGVGNPPLPPPPVSRRSGARMETMLKSLKEAKDSGWKGFVRPPRTRKRPQRGNGESGISEGSVPGNGHEKGTRRRVTPEGRKRRKVSGQPRLPFGPRDTEQWDNETSPKHFHVRKWGTKQRETRFLLDWVALEEPYDYHVTRFSFFMVLGPGKLPGKETPCISKER